MSELIDNSRRRKSILKQLILKLHSGVSGEAVRKELENTLRSIPYGEVVEVEQELLEEGLPQEEVLRLCDVHSAVLHGNVDLSAAGEIPEGHPVDVMIHENEEIRKTTDQARSLVSGMKNADPGSFTGDRMNLLQVFHLLMDVEKHYQRKEMLLFPYLEKYGLTGPPRVMWGKHDEIRERLKAAEDVLLTDALTREEFSGSVEWLLLPLLKSLDEMTVKEEEILFPMVMDHLNDSDWMEIQKQSLEIGFCLYDPPVDWKPETAEAHEPASPEAEGNMLQLPSGSFRVEELISIFRTMPVDITFVDHQDKVKYFSQGEERIFPRSRAILNRDVRHCHPPASAHIVDRILNDFRSGKQHRAAFWIQMKGRWIHIEYFALHNDTGAFLGTLEVSQDITRYRELEGEKRILSYE